MCETSHQCCIMRKAMSKEVGAGGRFDIFLDSGFSLLVLNLQILMKLGKGTSFFILAWRSMMKPVTLHSAKGRFSTF